MTDEEIAQAESALQTAQVVKPDSQELEAIKLFCALEVKRRNDSSASVESVRESRAAVKSLKDALAKDLLALSVNGAPAKCASLSKDDAKRLETSTNALGYPSLPPYLRLVSANKDATITAEVIQEALEAISEQDLLEASEEGTATGSIIRNVVLQHVRRAIRSFTESLKLVPSIQRGLSTYDVPEVSSATADRMYQVWHHEQLIKKILDSKKDPTAAKELEAYKTRIETFFIRTGLTAQRIVVEGKPYRLVRRVSVRKPKIGIGKLEKLLDEVLDEAPFKGSLIFKPAELIRALQIQVTSVAPETKSTVNLCSVKAPKE